MAGEVQKVVVIDDQEIALKAITRMLGDKIVVSCQHPERAVAIVDAERPQLVIVDLFMGRYSGIDVIRELRRRTPKLVIAIMSGALDTKNALEATLAGATLFLDKPLDKEFLYRALDRLGEAHAEPRVDQRTLEEVKHEHIDNVLEACGGNVSAAARMLDISRYTLQQHRKRTRRS